ncbi:MAG: hypothetical protein MR936_09660 [Eubacterium sp.]|nr:hypothetical protein [Eubacterium sp.]
MIKIGYIVKLNTEYHIKPKKETIKLPYKNIETDFGFVDFVQKREYNKRICNENEISSSVFDAEDRKTSLCPESKTGKQTGGD